MSADGEQHPPRPNISSTGFAHGDGPLPAPTSNRKEGYLRRWEHALRGLSVCRICTEGHPGKGTRQPVFSLIYFSVIISLSLSPLNHMNSVYQSPALFATPTLSFRIYSTIRSVFILQSFLHSHTNSNFQSGICKPCC